MFQPQHSGPHLGHTGDDLGFVTTAIADLAYLEHAPIDLRKQEIRLLRLDYRPDEPRIQCKIYSISLHAHIRFKALSYLWGLPSPMEYIRVQDSLLPIRRNLYDFLVVASSSRSFCENTLLFVDQICINQFDTAERSHQVEQMSAIYRAAEEVIVWLGPESPHSDSLMRAIAQSSSLTARHRSYLETERYRDLLQAAKLSRLKFWSRLWIAQECLLANELTIWWGGYRVDWMRALKFRDLYEKIHFSGEEDEENDESSDDEVGEREEQIDNLYAARRDRNPSGSYDFTWLQALDCTSKAQCEDPRDRIYGLLGLVKPELVIKPDYEKSVEDVFHEMVERECKHATLVRPDSLVWNLVREDLGLPPLVLQETVDPARLVMNSPVRSETIVWDDWIDLQ